MLLDANGEAVIQLPSYFGAINREFSYVLTPVGAPANMYVKAEVDSNGMFSIAGGSEGVKVSWYVYAERNDLFIQKNPDSKQVEVPKRIYEAGKYIRPELFNQPKEKGIFYRGEYKPAETLPVPAPAMYKPDGEK